MKRSARPRRWLPAVLLLASLLALLLVACTEGTTPADTAAPADTSVTSPSEDTAPATEPPAASDTQSETTAAATEAATTAEPETTESAIDRVNIPTDPAHVTFFQAKRLTSYLFNPNQCRATIEQDETYGSVLKLATTKGASDPYVGFNYENYLARALEEPLEPVSADEYKYLVFTIRVEDATSEAFELFYCAGGVSGPMPGYSKTVSFSATETGWQKIIFDLSAAEWSGDVHQFRMDFFTAPSGGVEVMYIYSIDFYKTLDEAYDSFDIDLSRPGEDSDLKEEPVNGVNYDKLTAPDEDASVKFWFDHPTEKLYQTDVIVKDMNTYVIHMAGNSIENGQFFLSPETDRSFNVSITDFTNEKGNVLKTALYREHYVNVTGHWLPDALPPIDGPVSVKGGQSQGFYIKVWADMNEPAGLYTATVTVTDAESGKVIKTANVYVNVWDFSLSDETAIKTAINTSPWPIVNSYNRAGMTDLSDVELYKIYYDFMLENRMAGYQLPYSLGDSRVVEYLNNPRMTSFAINYINGGDEAGAYNILKDNPEWLDKAYFYYVDEPTNRDLLDKLANRGNTLSQTFPGYNQISPFFTNINVDDGDQIEFMKPYLDIWCTKIFAFTPREKYMISGTQYLTTSAQDKKYGTFQERMAALQAEGDELWVYFCWEPAQPYTNWLALGDGTEPIVSLWQCKQVGATGVLYWYSNYWNSQDPMNDLTPLIGATAHGDGVLLYSGAAIGSYEPITSFRLENVRNGIQDYQLLTMVEELLGKEKMDEIIAMVTTDVITYTNDDDYLKAVRVQLFQLVSEALKG